jgi:phosphoglucosamine mutase
MEETGMSLAELSKDVIMYPDKMVNLKNVNKQLLNHPDLVTLVDEWKLRLGDKGKILVRASGTEPLVRISVSAESVEILEKCQNQIVDLLKRLNRQESHQ